MFYQGVILISTTRIYERILKTCLQEYAYLWSCWEIKMFHYLTTIDSKLFHSKLSLGLMECTELLLEEFHGCNRRILYRVHLSSHICHDQIKQIVTTINTTIAEECSEFFSLAFWICSGYFVGSVVSFDISADFIDFFGRKSEFLEILLCKGDSQLWMLYHDGSRERFFITIDTERVVSVLVYLAHIVIQRC